ncbi:MAG: ATP-binding protein [Chitinispirillaceae bacterium]|nr:ATP-binding protein [Chitinispirillaceae bacterium]
MVKQVAQFALSGSNVSIIFNEAPHLWPGNFDEIQIGQVVENIVINAMQAMPLGGAITFSAENAVISDNDVRGLSKGNYVRIAITDRGVGIPPEILPRIFDPFFTTKEMGRGLGLSTSYSIVVRHGGTIDVSSVVGMGSTFTIYLPALIDRTEAPSLSSDGSRKHSGKGTVLVMDDEEVIRETVSVMLENFGYSVLLARNGQEAVALYKNETSGGRTIVAMILDITVPGGMGGIATVAEIRKLGAETPVFVSSGYSEDPAMMIPANFGFTASIRKPYTSSDLSELFNAWVKTSR